MLIGKEMKINTSSGVTVIVPHLRVIDKMPKEILY